MSDNEGPFIAKGFKTCIAQNGVKHWSDGRGNKPTVSAGDRNQTHKAICLAQLDRNTSGEKRVKLFLGGCWCALPVWPEITSPQGGVHVVHVRQLGAGMHHLHYQGPSYYQKYQMCFPHSSPCVLWKQKDRSFPCCGLLVVSEEGTHCTGTGFICCHEGINPWELTRTWQVCPGALDCVTGKN